MHGLTEIIKMNTPAEVAKAQAYARALNGVPTVSRQKYLDLAAVLAAVARALPISSAFIAEAGKPWRTPQVPRKSPRKAKLC